LFGEKNRGAASRALSSQTPGKFGIFLKTILKILFFADGC